MIHILKVAAPAQSRLSLLARSAVGLEGYLWQSTSGVIVLSVDPPLHMVQSLAVVHAQQEECRFSA